jgi:hypothetical protein
MAHAYILSSLRDWLQVLVLTLLILVPSGLHTALGEALHKIVDIILDGHVCGWGGWTDQESIHSVNLHVQPTSTLALKLQASKILVTLQPIYFSNGRSRWVF